MSESPSSETAEPGRIISHTTPVNRTGWIRWFPGLDTLRHYKSSWLRHDFVAGLVMTTMLIPVLGPDSALAPVILAVVLPLSAGEPQRAVELAGMLAIVSGVVCIAAGLGRLGFVTELLSKPIRYGYMNGIALTVLLSQVPKLFGFSVTAKGPLRQVWGIVDKILKGNVNITALAIGAGTLVLILLLKSKPRLPGILIAVVAATVIVAACDLAHRAGVSV